MVGPSDLQQSVDQMRVEPRAKVLWENIHQIGKVSSRVLPYSGHLELVVEVSPLCVLVQPTQLIVFVLVEISVEHSFDDALVFLVVHGVEE